MATLKPGISVVINTKNEEHNIKDCINSVKDIAGEVIVVDMKSTDKTREIAQSLGAKVFEVEDYGYVEPARNFALSKPIYKWTLVVDADERLPKKLKSIILKLVEDNKYDGFRFPFKNMFFGTWIRHSMWWPDYHTRLFKTGCLDWPKGVHQNQNFKGVMFDLEPKEENAFYHNNIADIKEMTEMVDHYSGVEKIFASKKNPSAKEMVAYLNKEFTWRFIEHEGYLDGMHGFILAKYMNFYRFLEVAKYWERQEYKKFYTPEELKEAVLSESSQYSELERVKNDLNKIQSSKFYKLWQSYNRLKRLIIGKS